MKDKFFSLVGFLFDSIKVVAAVAVLTFIGVILLSLVRVAERMV